eukprot:scaffold40970_cov49-Attheya_sp.AAC.2
MENGIFLGPHPDEKVDETLLTNCDERLREEQCRVAPIAASFVPSTYKPAPFSTNCHLQSIAGVFLRNDPSCAYVSTQGVQSFASTVTSILAPKEKNGVLGSTYWDERERVDTPDGDFFHVDHKYVSSEKVRRGRVVMLHGLESSSNSTLSVDMAKAFHALNLDVACINFRGCSGVPNHKLGGYHLGFTDDLKQYLQILTERQEDSIDGLYLSGFSLGANVVLKALGELGDAAHTLYNVRGAAVTGAPFDLERNSAIFNGDQFFNRYIYSPNFLKTLRNRAQDQLAQFCDNDPNTDQFDFPRCMEAPTVAEFENGFIAPVYGFRDNIDYYRQCSCLRFLDGISVPSFVVNAGDDPFFDNTFFPWDKSVDHGGVAPIKMVRTDHGGHLGFMFHQSSTDDNGGRIDTNKPPASWMPMELARFIEHVHSHQTASQ